MNTTATFEKEIGNREGSCDASVVERDYPVPMGRRLAEPVVTPKDPQMGTWPSVSTFRGIPMLDDF